MKKKKAFYLYQKKAEEYNTQTQSIQSLSLSF